MSVYQIATDEGFPQYQKKYEEERDYAVINSLVRIPGEKSLLVAVIEQAIVDYFVLVRRGSMRFGNLTGKIGEARQRTYSKRTKERYVTHTVGGMTANDMRELVQFIKTDAATYADAADLSIDISGLFDKIIELEKTNRFRKNRGGHLAGLNNAITNAI